MRAAVAAALLLAASGAAAGVGGLDLAVGKAVFDRIWVPAPASTKSADGLGPLFAARSCAACHPKGERAAFVPGTNGAIQEPGLVFRLAAEAGAAHPVYGRELQIRGAPGQAGEGEARVRWNRLSPKLATLLEPDWHIGAWAYGAPGEVKISARTAPSLRGAALLDSVPEAAILAGADPDDRDGDGISGRAHVVRDANGAARIGRFGWKAAEPSLDAQIAAAFSLDLGLSTPLRPDAAGDCTEAQAACRAAPHGNADANSEVPEAMLQPLRTFVASLGPAPVAPLPSRGNELFASTGCAACHRPELPAAGGGARAYTDLLLHDLGIGLDDGLVEGEAAGAEWRTAPLWGIARSLERKAGLLHDGRARTVTEAVLWHGGEARAARERFEGLSAKERKALVDFVARL